MAIFAYDPAAFKTWADGVVGNLSGDGDSVDALSKKVMAQIDKLVQPNVWTGPAAVKNFEDFFSAHEALVKFVNSFGVAFEETMIALSKNVGELESANSGNRGTITSTYSGSNFSQLKNMAKTSINSEIVRYDYATIMSIGSELTSISNSLDNINNSLIKRINEIDSGASIWDGNAAATARESLSKIINENIPVIKEALSVCSKNIATAGEAARAADSAK